MLKKVAFTMYPIRDVARARRFYEETLGLEVGLHGNQGDQGGSSTTCRAEAASP